MNLVVDIGNSSMKLALLSQGEIVAGNRLESLSSRAVRSFLKGREIEKGIISSVRDIPGSLMKTLSSFTVNLHILSYRSRFPFKIAYETPETLGPDRLAAVAGAFLVSEGRDCLVIDAGTAITYEFIEGSVYTGGNISPGIDTRFRALNRFTGRLPLVARSEKFSFPGNSTRDALTAGVIYGVVFEINEYIRTFEEKHRNANVILTGGDSSWLKDRISGRFIYMPDIVMDGLNYILEYNAK